MQLNALSTDIFMLVTNNRLRRIRKEEKNENSIEDYQITFPEERKKQ